MRDPGNRGDREKTKDNVVESRNNLAQPRRGKQWGMHGYSKQKDTTLDITPLGEPDKNSKWKPSYKRGKRQEDYIWVDSGNRDTILLGEE